MVKGPPRVANRPNKQPGTGGRRTKGDELFIGPWLHALDLTQARVADDAGIGKPYMSQLVSGKYDKEPGHGVVRRIAQAMKITVDDLYKMPPPKKDLAPWRDVSAQARDALLAREMK